MSTRHLTEPAPYTRQVLSPAGAHSVSDGIHPFITARHSVSLKNFRDGTDGMMIDDDGGTDSVTDGICPVLSDRMCPTR